MDGLVIRNDGAEPSRIAVGAKASKAPTVRETLAGVRETIASLRADALRLHDRVVEANVTPTERMGQGGEFTEIPPLDRLAATIAKDARELGHTFADIERAIG